MSVNVDCGVHALEIPIPCGWKVRSIKKAGRPLTRIEMAEALETPVGVRRIQEIVRCADKLVIVVENHTDVLATEPPSVRYPLLAMENLIVTPRGMGIGTG